MPDLPDSIEAQIDFAWMPTLQLKQPPSQRSRHGISHGVENPGLPVRADAYPPSLSPARRQHFPCPTATHFL
jgi:hypothetical protein